MNYRIIHDNIIHRAKSENRIKLRKDDKFYVYYERHHIFPKSMGGTDNDENLVLLTSREHYIIHKILIKLYPNNIQLVRAFHMMTSVKRFKTIASNRDFEYARKLLGETPTSIESRKKMSDSAKNRSYTEDGLNRLKESYVNRIYSDETRKKMSESGKKRTHSDITKEKIRLSHIGKITSEETKKKISDKMKGKITWMKGKHHTEESKELISKSCKRRISEIT
jgi:hypothetical protein